MASLTACSPAASQDDSLTVFAAASLRDVFVDLETAWVADHPTAPLTIAHEASNVLAAQIGEGAPADVYVSAEADRPDQLWEAGLTAAAPVPFARNRVTIVTPAGDDRLESPADLAEPGVRIVASGPGVPITRYADEALAQLALTLPDPEMFTASVAGNIVSREDNVRAALAKVELGEGDAAVVYRTDALSSDRVREIALPAGIDVTAHYVAVQVSGRPEAAEFTAWLGGPAALEVMARHGFEVEGR